MAKKRKMWWSTERTNGKTKRRRWMKGSEREELMKMLREVWK
jgi:hypothetical protein